MPYLFPVLGLVSQFSGWRTVPYQSQRSSDGVPRLATVERARRSAAAGAVLCLLSMTFVLATPAMGGECSDRFPHEPAPSELWGFIRPVDTGALPSGGGNRRSTFYNGFQIADSFTPLWLDVDPAGDYLLTTMPYGLQIWDVGDGTSSDMFRIQNMSGWQGAYPSFPPLGEDDFIWLTGDTHEHAENRVYYAQVGLIGLAVWSWNPQSPFAVPKIHYQHEIDTLSQYVDVELLQVSGRVYAFVANNAGSLSRVEVYDVTASQPLNGCLDIGGVSTCANVHLGSFDVGESALRDISGVGQFLATTHSFSDGIRLWKVGSSVLSPQLLKEVAPSDNTKNSGLWLHKGSYGLAVQTNSNFKIFDVSACLGRGSCAAAAPVKYNKAFGGSAGLISVFSAGGRALAYSAHVSQCSGPENKEELLDVSELDEVREIMPRSTGSFPEGGPVDYPGWYTPQSGVGFQWYQPHRMTGLHDTIFRVAFTTFDHHLVPNVMTFSSSFEPGNLLEWSASDQ